MIKNQFVILHFFVFFFLFLTSFNSYGDSHIKSFITPIKPLKKLTTLQHNKVILGKVLFEDKALSKNKKMSCSSCHMSSKGYADGKRFSKDNAGVNKIYNTPSIEYSVYNYYFTWTGAFNSLYEHLDFLMKNSTLMNRNWDELTQQLTNTPIYKDLFTKAGYDVINRLSISDAIINFEKSLAKPSRFDLYLLGDNSQLTNDEVSGFELFKNSGCISCHQGINIGGNIRQKFGVMKSYFRTDTTKRRDLGFFNVSNKDEHKNYFRVPSLRNVGNTAPYFHDGSAATLEDAISIMYSYQLGIEASKDDILSIKSFLESLEPIQ